MAAKRAMTVEGTCETAFEPVRAAFAANFDDRDEVGAAVALYVDGRPVVDLWGGVADLATGRPWEEDTIALVFSTTKGATATCALLLVERGELDLDAPVADYWPEFAAAGKERIPVRWLLTHQAGLPLVDGDFTLEDVVAWKPIVDALAAQRPEWTPGTVHGYHMRTFGWLVGEVVRRVTRRTIGTFFAEEVAAPLGLDFWIGLPEEQESRCAAVVAPRGRHGEALELMGALPGDHLLARVAPGPSRLFAYDERWNRRELHAAEMPSSNGIGDARSLARLYAALVGEVDGVRLLGAETIAAAATPQASGPDRVLMRDMSFGVGFMVPPILSPVAGRGAFGHAGAGGSLAFADPEAGFGFAFVMNDLRFELTEDRRSRTLVEAVYDSFRDEGGSA
jgi:CubicO group peptidase (beta-lactamase class C family)